MNSNYITMARIHELASKIDYIHCCCCGEEAVADKFLPECVCYNCKSAVLTEGLTGWALPDREKEHACSCVLEKTNADIVADELIERLNNRGYDISSNEYWGVRDALIKFFNAQLEKFLEVHEK